MTRDQVAELLGVGEVAATFGVTVRTLHHYDEIGLLRPESRTSAGYRLYASADLDRLATIVGYRELGFSLEQVAELLRGSGDLAEHLRRQRDLVAQQVESHTRRLHAIDHALEAMMNNRPATHAELKELFGDGYDESYQAEAEERWGDTDAWAQSQQRTATYTKADWKQVKAETDALNERFRAAFASGAPATSAAAMDAAEAHRRHIAERFYDCPPAMHRGIGRLYVDDARFAKNYEELAPGLAAYVRDAIAANADRSA